MKLLLATLITLAFVTNNVAARSLDGELDTTCLTDDDCISGFCSVSSGKVCKEKLADGETCIENDDCIGNYCSGDFKCLSEKKANDESCKLDNDCAR